MNGVRPLARPPGAEWAGLLLVDKPAGVTSHDVVHRVRRVLGTRAIGHLGTLDPAATGLLVLAAGAATRCVLVWQGGQKTYLGIARFGVVTDSQDTTGRVLTTSERRPGEDEIREATRALTGDIAQVPPMVSALKRGGERLHVIARRGESIALEPRAVRVEAWRWHGFTADEARFEVDCSSGTYVRTLVHDLGNRLGCGAALASLRRLRSEPFALEHACPWAELGASTGAGVLGRFGIPLDRALEVLPAVTLDATAVVAVSRGQGPAVEAGAAPLEAGSRSVVLRSGDGRALALGELRRDGEGVRAWPSVVFPWAVAGNPGSASAGAASPAPTREDS